MRRGGYDQFVAVAYRFEPDDLADAIDMTRHQMTAQSVGQSERLFQIQFIAKLIQPDSAAERFTRDIHYKAAAMQLDCGQAYTVTGNAVARLDIEKIQPRSLDGQPDIAPSRFKMGNVAKRLDDAGKHGIRLSTNGKAEL